MATEKGCKLSILYATQTGNALDVAERVAREAAVRGCSASLKSIDEFDAGHPHHEDILFFIVSTTGQGDPPDSMKGFWRFLLQKHLTMHWLEGVTYAVFGLGDSGYQKYNFVAKKLDRRLSDLGATPIIERGLGDDQHPLGYEGALDPWLSSLWHMLYEINPRLFPAGPVHLVSGDKSIDQAKVQIKYYANSDTNAQLSTLDLEDMGIQMGRVRAMSPARIFHQKDKPSCFLKMIQNKLLTRERCGKDVRHFEFEFASSTVEYNVGDVVELLPSQSSTAVDALIKRCGLDPTSLITVHSREKEGEILNSLPVKLKSFVELTMDIASASPRRYFFEVMSLFATAPHEKEKLEYFVSPEGRDDLYRYNQKERRTVLEVLEDFPSVRMPFEWLVQLAPPLKTRAFSISSSPSAHPGRVHLTVNVVSWETPLKRKRAGLCSKWLAELDPSSRSACVPAWFRKGLLPPPPPSLPLILVGPGTGCAPFRGFIEERAVQEASDGPTAPVLFFFGCRGADDDFLYKDFWLSHAQGRGGLLSEARGGGFFTAFSRDQPHDKVYVQHRMLQNKSKIRELLCSGASIYVAGSAAKMPAQVLSAFQEIMFQESPLSKEQVAVLTSRWERGRKYHVEAWS